MEHSQADSELLKRVRDSDTDAFRQLFERYQPIVFRQVVYQTGDQDAAHDIVQETFVRIWDRRETLKPESSFLAYAFRISGNLVRDAARHRAVRERSSHSIPKPPLSEGDDPEEALKRTMLEEHISAILRHDLPNRCREIFLLSRFEGKSHRDIAAMLGVAEKTVENQINRALKVLRKRLGKP